MTTIEPIKMPLAVQLDRNKFIGRAAIESVLYAPLLVATARNADERLENFLDWATWMVMGVTLPIFLDRTASRAYSDQLRRQFNLPKVPEGANKVQASLLNIPLEWVEKSGRLVRDAQGQLLPEARKQLVHLTEQLHLNHPGQLEKLLENPEFVSKLRVGKVGVMWAGLGLMAAKGQLYSWGKNWVTEKRSGKKGFSGEFNYTDEQYRQQKSTWFTKTQTIRQKISVGMGLGAAALFPLAVMGTLKNWPGLKSMTGLIPRLNYTDGIFMPKEVFLVHTLFNYNLPALLASRDWDEMREKAVKCLAFDTFYYVGDDFIAGKTAQFLQKRLKLDKAITELKRGFVGLKFKHAKPLEAVFRDVAAKPGMTQALLKADPAYKATEQSFWAGFLGTSLGMGLIVPISNNFYTHKQVMADMAKQQPKPTDVLPVEKNDSPVVSHPAPVVISPPISGVPTFPVSSLVIPSPAFQSNSLDPPVLLAPLTQSLLEPATNQELLTKTGHW